MSTGQKNQIQSDTNLLIRCPLCLHSDPTTDVKGADRRRYHLCHTCSLIFADPGHHLSLAAEKDYYTSTHQNSIENDGYVQFLNRILLPMLPYLDQTMLGLDYGSGPGPTLSQLVRKQGIACEDYDPIFASRSLQAKSLQARYDFIFSTECFEHFYYPQQEIQQICKLLKPGGLLGVMTEQWTTLEKFAHWYYTTDPTHTSFYHENTFRFLSQHYGLALLWQDRHRVFIFRYTDAALSI